MRRRLHPAPALVLLVLVSALPAAAQFEVLAKTTPEQRAQFQTDFMKKNLDLNTEQLEKISEINLSMATHAEPILKGDSSRFSKAMKIRKLEAKREKSLRVVLTKEQFEHFGDSKGELRDALLEHFGSSKPTNGS